MEDRKPRSIHPSILLSIESIRFGLVFIYINVYSFSFSFILETTASSALIPYTQQQRLRQLKNKEFNIGTKSDKYPCF